MRPLIYADVFSKLTDSPDLVKMGSDLEGSWQTDYGDLLNQPIITKPSSNVVTIEGEQTQSPADAETVFQRWTATRKYVDEILKLFPETLPHPARPWFTETNSAQLMHNAFLEQAESNLPTIHDGDGQGITDWSVISRRFLTKQEWTQRGCRQRQITSCMDRRLPKRILTQFPPKYG